MRALAVLCWLWLGAGCDTTPTAHSLLDIDRSSSVPTGYLLSAPAVPTHPDKVAAAGLGLDEARARARQDALVEVERSLDETLRASPDDPDALLLLGVVSWERANLTVPMDSRERHAQLGRAQRAFEAVVAQDPDALDAWWGLLRTWHSPARAFAQGQPQDLQRPLQAAEQVLVLDPDNWVAGLDRGVLLFEVGELEEARDQLEAVTADLRLDAQPGLRAQAWEHLGRAQLALGELGPAEASLRTALASWDSLGGTTPYYRGCPLMSLGQIMVATGEGDQARELYTQAAHIDASDPDKALTKALANLAADQYARAADVLTLLAEADLAAVGSAEDRAAEIQGQARALLVLVALALGDEDEAARHLALAPAGPLRQLGAGQLALQRGELPQARAQLEGALAELSPNGRLSPSPGLLWIAQRMALLGLGWVAGLEGQHAAALAYHQRVSAHSPGDPLAAAGQARAMLELGRSDQARAVLQRALGRHRNSALLINTLGVIQLEAGELAEARESFQEAQRLGGAGYTCPLEGLGMVTLLSEQQDPALGAKQQELERLLADRSQGDPGSYPNFLVIDIDSLRDDRVEDPDLRPPAIAGLAARGVIFEDNTSQSGWTLPALASLLTGRLPPVVELAKQRVQWIPDDPAPLPLILDHYGYHTAAFWGETAPTVLQRFCAGFDHEQRAGGPAGPDRYHAPVVRWLEAEATEPFFALVHNVDLTNEPPEAGLARLRDLGIPKPAGQRMGMELLQQQAASHLDEPAAQQLCIETYDARLAAYDHAIAAMLDALEARGLRERTVVILTSNHGQDLFEHGLVGHGSILYQSVLQVPLLVVDPALEGQASTIDAPVQGVDLAPYVLERAGIPASATMDGRSFLPLLEDSRASWPDRPAVSVTNRYGVALRVGDQKIVRHTLDPHHNGYKPDQGEQPAWPPVTVTQRFDLTADPGEQHDLAATDPELLATLQEELDHWTAFLEQRSAGTAPQDAPELQQALRDRGYWMHVQEEGGE